MLFYHRMHPCPPTPASHTSKCFIVEGKDEPTYSSYVLLPADEKSSYLILSYRVSSRQMGKDEEIFFVN